MPARKPAVRPAVEDVEGLFRGFADPTRIRILNVLAAGELCVCDVVSLLGLSQPLISRHLAYLRRVGLVEARPDVRFTYYRLAEAQNSIHRKLVGCVGSCFRDIRSLDREHALAEQRVARRAAKPCT